MKTINGTKGTSAMNRGVLLPKISDFWDRTKGRYSTLRDKA